MSKGASAISIIMALVLGFVVGNITGSKAPAEPGGEVAAEASAQPLILVLEDLQWGDLATVRAVDALLRNLHGLPLFVLGTARPEALQIFPGLWEKRNPEIIRAGALTPKASARLVRDVLGASVPDELLERIVARAAGHPLHLEEIVRAVAEAQAASAPLPAAQWICT